MRPYSTRSGEANHPREPHAKLRKLACITLLRSAQHCARGPRRTATPTACAPTARLPPSPSTSLTAPSHGRHTRPQSSTRSTSCNADRAAAAGTCSHSERIRRQDRRGKCAAHHPTTPAAQPCIRATSQCARRARQCSVVQQQQQQQQSSCCSRAALRACLLTSHFRSTGCS